jgi:hypothetical protein
MSDLENFFAAPRKVKAEEKKTLPKVEEKIEIEKEDIEVKEEVSEPKFVPMVEEDFPRERYQATPKKKIERKFDKFVSKRTQLNEDDTIFLMSLEKSISFDRKKMNVDPSVNRVTANTIIRLVIENFVDKAEEYIEKHPKIYSHLQTEDDIKEWITKLKT